MSDAPGPRTAGLSGGDTSADDEVHGVGPTVVHSVEPLDWVEGPLDHRQLEQLHASRPFHEGGELGYSLLPAFGAVLDNPHLVALWVVGDGEVETGPLATSWHVPSARSELVYASL